MSCEACGGNRLQLGGWMGPTREAPFPRPCPVCSPSLSPREIQVAQTVWFLNNQHRPDVQQILARSAVIQALTYAKVVEVGPTPFTVTVGVARVLADADLVIGPDRVVLKDCWGTAGYKLSESEYRRIRDDCQEFVDGR